MSAVLDFSVKPEARPYLDAFERQPTREEPDWLGASRRRGLARFAELGFPSRKSENWRYLDLQRLAESPLPPAVPDLKASLDWAREHLAGLLLPGKGPRLVLVDGVAAPELSSLEMPEGVWFGPTRRALLDPEYPVDAVTKRTDGDAAHPFAALNAALFSDGFVLDIASGVQLEQPIEVVHLATGAVPASFHTRNVVMLDTGSHASVFEIYAGESRYWRNDVARVELGRGAVLRRVVLVEEAREAIHLGLTDARLDAGAQLHGFALLLGGRTVRQEANVRLAGEGAHCRLDGAYVVSGGDEANIVATVDHAAPGCETRELVKGVAAGRGHGAFQGRIIVREHAQKTDAQQLSRNLLLGRRAAIDTKPELEIFADDVKCSHGASVGDLDEAALFYLRARGIPEDEARRLLVEGFLREAVERVEAPAVRDHLLQRLALRLAALEASP